MRIDRGAVIHVAPAAGQVKVFERKANWVHDAVTACTYWISPVLFEPRAQRVRMNCTIRIFTRIEIGFDAGRWVGHGRAENVFHDPYSAHDRRSTIRN